MRKFLLVLLFFTANLCFSFAQKMTPEQYVSMYKDMAMLEMRRTGVPASITLAQGILESESGNSILVKKSNNHFGIKCKSNWKGESVSHDDDELGECFRSYKNWEDSYKDHSDFLKNSNRYASLFLLDPYDYKSWAKGLKNAGYATNPKYPDLLIKCVENYNLQQYTIFALDENYVINYQLPIQETTVSLTEPVIDNTLETTISNVPAPQPIVETSLEVGNLKSINGSKVVYVKKGTSWLSIAMDNKLSLSKLLQFNDREIDGLTEKDQYVFLEKKKKEGENVFVIVNAGESLYDIAQNNGVILKNICKLNGMEENQNLTVGSKIYLKPSTLVMQSAPSLINEPMGSHDLNKNASEEITYEVQPKEGLYAIAKKFGVTVDQIKEWNNLKNNQLQIGQRLIILK